MSADPIVLLPINNEKADAEAVADAQVKMLRSMLERLSDGSEAQVAIEAERLDEAARG